jgi:hypothetical protein
VPDVLSPVAQDVDPTGRAQYFQSTFQPCCPPLVALDKNPLAARPHQGENEPWKPTTAAEVGGDLRRRRHHSGEGLATLHLSGYRPRAEEAKPASLK